MKVLAIAPYEGLKELLINQANEEDVNIVAEVGDLKQGLALAKNAVNNDVDIIISRGLTSELIQHELSIPVVDVIVSGYDMLRVLTLVKDYPGQAAIVGFPSILEGASTVSGILDMDISMFELTHEDDVDPLLQKLKSEGYQVVVGGVHTVERAEAFGLHGILLTSGAESVKRAFQIAKRIYKIINDLKKNYLIPHSLLQEKAEGIAVYDDNLKLVYSNRSYKEQFANSIGSRLDFKGAIKEIKRVGFFKKVLIHENRKMSVAGELMPSSGERWFLFKVNSRDDRLSMEMQGVQIITSGQSAAKTAKILVTKNPDLNEVLKKAQIFSKSDLPLWISGEKGTGKSTLARNLHSRVMCKGDHLIILDCELMKEDQWHRLLYDEENRFEFSKRGTVFFKNIEHLHRRIQDMLYDYLYKNPLKCKVISSSKVKPATLVQKEFNERLYYLLAQCTVELPPLRNRKEDIEGLSLWLLNDWNTKNGKQLVGIRKEAKEGLEAFEWPGNLHQLKQVLDEGFLVAKGPYLELDDISASLVTTPELMEEVKIDLTGTLEEIEQRIIRQVWLEEGKNQTRTANRLKINRTTLWRKLK
ncbi:PrpR N-terminal domain-containing protein [Fictibacillus enclensis]|uniref:sigma-54-dependent transcriptional regulator n=1 Tax=Fictibacillus enclensis TaxID=1017270 RepID=UPI0025A281B0|nr:sigma-54-dependent transcriptional regulator [Fictibacillus enclensis]MDM5338206.1 PrpR N-terminal domain-containing protein [Fictibacillus enclensis]